MLPWDHSFPWRTNCILWGDSPDELRTVLGDDLRLSAGSPAIDAGNTIAYLGPGADVGGNPRAVDDPSTADTGFRTVGIAIPFLHATIDMGAHEFGASPFDRNHDGRVDLDDFSEFMKAFTGP